MGSRAVCFGAALPLMVSTGTSSVTGILAILPPHRRRHLMAHILVPASALLPRWRGRNCSCTCAMFFPYCWSTNSVLGATAFWSLRTLAHRKSRHCFTYSTALTKDGPSDGLSASARPNSSPTGRSIQQAATMLQTSSSSLSGHCRLLASSAYPCRLIGYKRQQYRNGIFPPKTGPI